MPPNRGQAFSLSGKGRIGIYYQFIYQDKDLNWMSVYPENKI